MDDGQLDIFAQPEEVRVLPLVLDELALEAGFSDEMTLREARDLLDGLLIEGKYKSRLHCPCCGRVAAIYSKPFNRTQAWSLVAMYRAWGSEWGDLARLRRDVGLHHSNQEAQLRHLGLIEENPVRREDGGHAGWWRVTPLGVDWLHGRVSVRSRVVTHNAMGREPEGKRVYVADLLPGFDLRRLDYGLPGA